MSLDKELPEVSELLKVYKTIRSKAKSAYNKFKRATNYFYFLDIIIKSKQYTDKEGGKEDRKFEIAIKDLFNSIGIKSVIPQTKKDFDVKCVFKEIKLGIEAKNGKLPNENEMFQAHKYAVRGNREYLPIIIWNNNGKNRNEFDKEKILDAELNSYGIITTTELRKGYLMLKNDKITFDVFLKILQKKGLIKYTLKSVKIETG